MNQYKMIGCFFILSLLLSQCAFSIEPLSKDDFAFVFLPSEDIVGFYDNPNNFQTFLGEPVVSVFKEDKARPEWTWLQMDWSGLKIITFSGHPVIFQMEITGLNFSTMRGISIGDERSKVIKAYGEPKLKVKQFSSYSIKNPTDPNGNNWEIAFKYNSQGIVKSIVITQGD